MLTASVWQWKRYGYKIELQKTYAANSTAEALPFPESGKTAQDFEGILYRKVALSGSYDFSRQIVVINRRHAIGAGYWLLTPFKLKNSEQHVIVSRGFIPFEDREPDTWTKYDFSVEEQLQGVTQRTVPPRTWFTPQSALDYEEEFPRKWRYPDIENIAKKLPYPVITAVFVQRLGPAPSGTFPAEAITFDVPPSTHFGYAIEWILLALATLIVAFLLQSFPRRKRNAALREPKKESPNFPLSGNLNN